MIISGYNLNIQGLDDLRITEINIITKIMSPVSIILTGVPYDNQSIIELKSEYQFDFESPDGKFYSGALTIIDQSTTEHNGNYKLIGYVGSSELILERANRYFTSIYDGISRLCNEMVIPQDLTDREEYHNQTGQLNYEFALQLGLKNSAYHLPSFTLAGYKLIDVHSGDIELNISPAELRLVTKINSKSSNIIDPNVDSFEVAISNSDISIGTYGMLSSRDVVDSYYQSSYEAYATNIQVIRDIATAGSINYKGTDLIELNNIIIYNSIRYLVVGTNLHITNNGTSTNCKIILPYE